MRSLWIISWKSLAFLIVWAALAAALIVPLSDRLEAMEPGWPLLTGGAFGLEGGAVTSLTTLLVIGGLVALYPRPSEAA